MKNKICDCIYEMSCLRCRTKCKEYINYISEKEIEGLMQGEDRQPMVRKNGALRRKNSTYI